jgi:hypothetical protein
MASRAKNVGTEPLAVRISHQCVPFPFGSTPNLDTLHGGVPGERASSTGLWGGRGSNPNASSNPRYNSKYDANR